jgi:sucrose-6-phosphate hydrolase SacC (GH32 family)
MVRILESVDVCLGTLTLFYTSAKPKPLTTALFSAGPFYHNGIYHLMYQYNPAGPTFGTGKLSWGHSVSGDLINWAFLGTALDPTSPFDADGCWSGSVTVPPGGRPVIIYTGRDTNTVQVQNVAFAADPSDPLLREWRKSSSNPVIPQPADVTGNNFRDPTTAWLGRDGLWRVAVAGEVGGTGATLVYRSADFLRWERNAAPLHSSPHLPAFECPDLFPVLADGTDGLDCSVRGPGVRHVLKLSKIADEDYYMVGRYDDADDTFVPGEERGDDVKNWRRVDHGHLFGAKSFFDARKNRRVLWAWVDDTDGPPGQAGKSWTGIQAFPRALWLDADDGTQLVQWPIEEIETLRTTSRRVVLQGAGLRPGGRHEVAGVQTVQADVEVVFEIPNLEEAEKLDPSWLKHPQKLCEEKGAAVQGGVGPFGLVVMASGDMEEHTSVFFRVFKHEDTYKVLMCTDLTRYFFLNTLVLIR